MKRILGLIPVFILTLIFAFIAGTTTAQTRVWNFEYHFEKDSSNNSESCLFKLERYYSHDFVYPESATKKNIQGRVLVSFDLSDNCDMTNIKVTRGLGHGLDEIALEIISELGKNIKKKQGQCCKFSMTIPVAFRLE